MNSLTCLPVSNYFRLVFYFLQVYPAVEYDFVPNKLNIQKETDVVHIQWAGRVIEKHVWGGGG